MDIFIEYNRTKIYFAAEWWKTDEKKKMILFRCKTIINLVLLLEFIYI